MARANQSVTVDIAVNVTVEVRSPAGRARRASGGAVSHKPKVIESRTFDGTCWLASHDVARALRARADELDHAAAALGDDLDGEQWTDAVAYRTAARELRGRADALDFAVIAHVEDPRLHRHTEEDAP